MRIGDKVRLLRGTEEGRIVKIKDNKIVEIEIEDGFIIPAMKNEVVVISKVESEYFEVDEKEKEEKPLPDSQDDFIAEGIYLGFINTVNSEFEGYVLNQTNSTILFSLSQYDKKNIYGKAHGSCEAYGIKHIGTLTSSIFNDTKKLLVHLIFHEQETRLKKQPETYDINIKANQLQEKVYLNSISNEIALVKLGEIKKEKIDPIDLQNRMMEAKPDISAKKESHPRKDELSIDLHIDEYATKIPSIEILDHQLNEFEKAYDAALVMNVKKLKIIHGVGSGVLRNEIHKRISKKEAVNYFEDADKERFGFGSTIIYF